MVKVKDFQAALFHSNQYQNLLYNNIEHLEPIPMTKTFNSTHMIQQGLLTQETQPFTYIYRQIYMNHVSYGILAEISLEDYHHNAIKRHEKTLIREGMNHKTYKKDHVGPVVVCHRQDQQIKNIILSYVQKNKEYSQWTTKDGREHSLWRIEKDFDNIQARFQKIQSLYILDGHHRLQAAHQNYLLSDKTNQKDKWIQALIYSSEYIMIHPQHRIIQDFPVNISIINELLKMEHLQMTEIIFSTLSQVKIKEELYNYSVILKLHQKLYGINFNNTSRNILQKVNAFRLQHQIFNKLNQPEAFQKLKFVPGIIEDAHIFEHEIVFFLKQPEIDIVFEIADAQFIMPPKSTWIEPKPCSHMVIRMFG